MSYLLVSERETDKNLKVLSKFRKTRTCNWNKKTEHCRNDIWKKWIFEISGLLKYRVCFSFVNFGFNNFHRNLDFESIPVLETKMKGYCS